MERMKFPHRPQRRRDSQAGALIFNVLVFYVNFINPLGFLVWGSVSGRNPRTARALEVWWTRQQKKGRGREPGNDANQGGDLFFFFKGGFPG